MRSRALEAPRPLARNSGMTRRSRRHSAAKIERAATRRTAVTTLTGALRRERGAGVGSRRRRSRRRERLRRVMRRTSGEQPTFQRASTRRPRRLPPRTVLPGGTASVALHGASLASNHLVTRGGGVLLRLRARTGSSLTLHFGSLSAGPHERCRLSTTRSAFHPRSVAVRPGRVSSLELGPPLPPWPRPRRKRANPGVAHRLLQPT